MAQGVVHQVAHHPLDQRRLAHHPNRFVQAFSPQVDTLRHGFGHVPHHRLTHQGVQAQCLQGQALLGLIRIGQGQQLVHQMRGPLLTLHNGLQLLAPLVWVVLLQAKFGQGANARQRGAQLMGHIARELTLRAHTIIQPHQQIIERLTQAAHIARSTHGGQGTQVTHIAAQNALLQQKQRVNFFLNGAAQAPAQQHQQHDLGHHGDPQQALQQASPAGGGLRHHHMKGQWLASVDCDAAHGFALKHHVFKHGRNHLRRAAGA